VHRIPLKHLIDTKIIRYSYHSFSRPTTVLTVALVPQCCVRVLSPSSVCTEYIVG